MKKTILIVILLVVQSSFSQIIMTSFQGVVSSKKAVVVPKTTVTIDTQVWTTKNLDVATYSDGTEIPEVKDPSAWASLTTGAWCYYNNDSANGAIYGKLYNWYAVAGIHDEDSKTDASKRKKLAPTGFHVPTDTEWTTLIQLSNYKFYYVGIYLNSNVGGHWVESKTDYVALNSSGFTGLPGGYRANDFTGINYTVSWWTSTGTTNDATNFFTYEASEGSFGNLVSYAGCSVRLVKNTAPSAPTITDVTVGNTQATVSFTAPTSDGGSAITGYTVTSSPESSPATFTGTTSPIVVTGLTNGTSYTFTVVATNEVGNSVASEASEAVTPFISVPDAPTSPVATAGNTEATLSFTAPTSGGSAITGYTVTSSPASSPATFTGTTSPIVVTGLTNGTSYTFTVVATNAAGSSVASDYSEGVTPNCGAYVSAGVYKVFACHNLGADTALDPNVPVQGIHGDYYQWGRSTPAATSDAIIGSWNTTAAANGSWSDGGTKSTNDPCPTGFRVPTKAQWDQVIANNTMSITGSWIADGNFTTAIHWGPNANTKTLTLPAAGYRYSSAGKLYDRGGYGVYWSSTEAYTSAWYLYFDSSYAYTYSTNLANGFSVRCVLE